MIQYPIRLSINFNYLKMVATVSRSDYLEILESIPGIVFEFDSTGNLTYTNRQANIELGYSDYELKNMTVLDFLIPSDRERAVKGMSNIFIGKKYQSVPYTFQKKDGTTSPFHVYINQIYRNKRIAGARGLAVRINEITETEEQLLEVKKKQDQLVNMAVFSSVYDPLTGLLNKDTFLARIQVQIFKSTRRKNKNGSFSILCLSIDKFKDINDIHGLKAGNYILVETAKRMRNIFRKDDVISRSDGNKFYVLLLDIGKNDNISLVMNKIFTEFDQQIIFDNKSINITVSIGLTLYPEDGNDEITLIKHSEEAMYNARKKKDSSYQLFDEKIHQKLLDRISIDYELKHAILNDEFFPLFQPKYDRSMNITGVEALIRWNSPSRGLVSPFDFIPIAEDNGLIVEIGKIILTKACRQATSWHSSGLKKINVAVNLSPYQFNHRDLVNEIDNIIEESGLDKKFLELEITESGIIMNEYETIEKLKELHDMEISIAIDDFGTGYSSLSKLQNYPIDTLKMDKSFVDHLPHNERSVTLAKTIIDLAHNLGFHVVAEGVETEEQLNFLYTNNCDMFQGYYFEKPVTSEKIIEILETEILEKDFQSLQ